MNTIRINLHRIPQADLHTLEHSFDCHIRLNNYESEVTIDPICIPTFLFCVNALRSRQIEMGMLNGRTHQARF